LHDPDTADEGHTERSGTRPAASRSQPDRNHGRHRRLRQGRWDRRRDADQSDRDSLHGQAPSLSKPLPAETAAHSAATLSVLTIRVARATHPGRQRCQTSPLAGEPTRGGLKNRRWAGEATPLGPLALRGAGAFPHRTGLPGAGISSPAARELKRLPCSNRRVPARVRHLRHCSNCGRAGAPFQPGIRRKGASSFAQRGSWHVRFLVFDGSSRHHDTGDVP
jgi:hypothetical protein